jgi:hypothetical protein
MPEKKPFPIPRPKFPESTKPPAPRVQRCQLCHQFKIETPSETTNKSKQKLHTCHTAPCKDFISCPTLYLDGKLYFALHICVIYTIVLHNIKGHKEEQKKQAEIIANWKAEKDAWDTDIEQKRQAVQSVKAQQKAEVEKKKEEVEKLKRTAHVEEQSWKKVLDPDDTYVPASLHFCIHNTHHLTGQQTDQLHWGN